MATYRHTAHKIVMLAYKMAAMKRGEEVEIAGAFWSLHDAADISGIEHKRGQVVLQERRLDGKIEHHWAYKWPSVDEVHHEHPAP